MNNGVAAGVAIVTGIIGLAALAVIVGGKNSANVIQALGSSLGGLIKAATSPASGGF